MAAKPALTSETIALTEKKIDMTLDDIIKMSKKPAAKGRNARIANKNRGFLNNGTSQTRASNLKRFMDSRSTLRQGVLAQKRSNFKASSQFPLTTEAARKASSDLVRTKVPNWRKSRPVTTVQRKVGQVSSAYPAKTGVPKQMPRTLDSLFANMKEQRLIRARARALNGQPGMRRGRFPRNNVVGNNRNGPAK